MSEATAEVDFLLQDNTSLFPVEVKSGTLWVGRASVFTSTASRRNWHCLLHEQPEKGWCDSQYSRIPRGLDEKVDKNIILESIQQDL